MRRGRVFRRCTDCGSTVAGKRCACGSDRASWAFQVDLNARGEPRRQAKRSGFATKNSAVAAMADVLASAASGKGEPTKMTTGQFLDEWLPMLKARGSTLASYELIIRRHLKPAIGAVPLRYLTRTRVKEAYAAMEASGLSGKSVHNAHIVLRRALAEAVDDGLNREPGGEGSQDQRGAAHPSTASESGGSGASIAVAGSPPPALVRAPTAAATQSAGSASALARGPAGQCDECLAFYRAVGVEFEVVPWRAKVVVEAPEREKATIGVPEPV